MGYGIVMVLMAIVAQAAEPARGAEGQVKTPSDQAAGSKLQEAHRLLRNGRYAEAEEALAAIEARGPEGAGRLSTPALALALAGKSECQASQGEYAKAIDGLKAAAAEEPKNADLPARLAELYLTRGDWEAAEAAVRPAPRSSTPTTCGPLGRGAAARAARRAREGRRRLEVVRRPLQREAGRDRHERRGAAPGRPGRRALLPRQRARRRAGRRAQRRDQRDLRGGAAGRPQLLAGPLARGAALPLGLQRAAGDARAGPRPADQPAGARGAGDARARPTSRATGWPRAGPRPSGPWPSTRTTRRPTCCWPT